MFRGSHHDLRNMLMSALYRHRRSLLQPKRIALICDRDKLLTYLNLHIVSSPIGIALHETFGDNQLISTRYM